MNRYSITMQVYPTTIKVFYEKADSINIKQLKPIFHDFTLIVSAIRLLGKKQLIIADSLLNDSAAVYFKKVDSARRESTYYSRDTVVIPKSKNEIALLLDTIFNSSLEELKRVNTNRGILDGTYFTFTIHNNGNTKTIQAHSPGATSQPLLGKLIAQTIALLPEKERSKYYR